MNRSSRSRVLRWCVTAALAGAAAAAIALVVRSTSGPVGAPGGAGESSAAGGTSATESGDAAAGGEPQHGDAADADPPGGAGTGATGATRPQDSNVSVSRSDTSADRDGAAAAATKTGAPGVDAATSGEGAGALLPDARVKVRVRAGRATSSEVAPDAPGFATAPAEGVSVAAILDREPAVSAGGPLRLWFTVSNSTNAPVGLPPPHALLTSAMPVWVRFEHPPNRDLLPGRWYRLARPENPNLPVSVLRGRGWSELASGGSADLWVDLADVTLSVPDADRVTKLWKGDLTSVSGVVEIALAVRSPDGRTVTRSAPVELELPRSSSDAPDRGWLRAHGIPASMGLDASTVRQADVVRRIAELAEFLASFPDSPWRDDARVAVGVLRTRTEDWERGVAEIRDAIASIASPSLRCYARTAAAVCLVQHGHPSDARTLFRAADSAEASENLRTAERLLGL